MIEELPDDIETDIDDIEPVGEEANAQLYEHFRVEKRTEREKKEKRV